MIPFAVAAAGGIGAVLRFVVDGVVARHVHARLPLGTVIVNVSGCLFLGLLTGLALDHAGLGDLKLVLGTGLAGGYTTFSTASVEAVNLALQDGPRSTVGAVVHAAGMLVLGVSAAALGLWLT